MSTRSSTSWYVYRAAASVARRTWRLLSRNKLSVAERASVLATLNHESFLDNSVAQVWATLLDEGGYGQTGMRSDQATGLRPARRSVLMAVRQARKAAEILRRVGHRRRTEPRVPAVFGHRSQVPHEPGPAGEPVLAGNDQLRGAELQAARVVGHPIRVVAGQPHNRAGVAGPNGPLQGTGLPAEAVNVGTVGHAQGRHNGLLSYA